MRKMFRIRRWFFFAIHPARHITAMYPDKCFVCHVTRDMSCKTSRRRDISQHMSCEKFRTEAKPFCGMSWKMCVTFSRQYQPFAICLVKWTTGLHVVLYVLRKVLVKYVLSNYSQFTSQWPVGYLMRFRKKDSGHILRNGIIWPMCKSLRKKHLLFNYFWSEIFSKKGFARLWKCLAQFINCMIFHF